MDEAVISGGAPRKSTPDVPSFPPPRRSPRPEQIYLLFAACGIALGSLVGVLLGYSESPTVSAVLTGVLPLAAIAAPMLSSGRGTGVRLIGCLWFLLTFAIAVALVSLISASERGKALSPFWRLVEQFQSIDAYKERSVAVEKVLDLMKSEGFDPAVIGGQGSSLFYVTSGSDGKAVPIVCSAIGGVSDFPDDLLNKLLTSNDPRSQEIGLMALAIPTQTRGGIMIQVRDKVCG